MNLLNRFRLSGPLEPGLTGDRWRRSISIRDGSRGDTGGVPGAAPHPPIILGKITRGKASRGNDPGKTMQGKRSRKNDPGKTIQEKRCREILPGRRGKAPSQAGGGALLSPPKRGVFSAAARKIPTFPSWECELGGVNWSAGSAVVPKNKH